MTERLDTYLQREIEKEFGVKLSRSYIERILDMGGVSFNDEIIKKKGFQVNPEKHKIILDKSIVQNFLSVYQTGKQQDTEANRWDASEIGIEVDESRVEKAGDIRKCIVFENDDIMVVDKPSGVSSHPGKRDRGADSMVYQFIKYMRNAHKYIPRAGLLHRLDKDTSGILMFAKNMQVYNEIKSEFEARSIKKYYVATCTVTPRLSNLIKNKGIISNFDLKSTVAWEKIVENVKKKQESIELDGFISKRKSGISMVFTPEASIAKTLTAPKECSSSIYVLFQDDEKIVLLFEPHTGRTHQIRAQAQFLGCPVINDRIYGRAYTLKGKLGLRAVGIKLTVGGQEFKFFLK